MRFCVATGARRRIAHAAIGLAVLGASGIGAAQASAATLSVNKTCYVDTMSKTGLQAAAMLVTGTGYVPGDSVAISATDGSTSGMAVVGSSGAFAVTIAAPRPLFSRPGSKVSVLEAKDYATTGTITGATFVKSTELAVATVPATARPSRRVTWYFSGFRPGHYVYGHYLRRGREVARARFGRAKGVCGLLRVKARFFPGGHQRYRTYGLQFDDSLHYGRRSRPRIVTTLGTF